jgi:methylated-DNA-[protein]-cysteine S-methyltransferase
MPPRATVPAFVDSPIGRLWVVATDAGVLAAARADDPIGLLALLDRPGVIPSATATGDARRQLAAYLAGRRRSFNLRLDLRGVAPFDAAVYRAALAIPYGATASYGDLAAAVGAPRAARAVGNAMARCRFSPFVPAHRVIRANGSIGGWGGDTWVKRWLLDLERG